MAHLHPWTAVGRTLLTLGIAVLGPATVAAQGSQAREEGIEEEIRVFESRITLEFDGLTYREASRIDPTSVVVVEAGAPREVTSLRLLSAVKNWRTVIYVDAPLTRSQTVRTAALALGGHAESLTRRGSVEIIVADPDPRQVLAPKVQSGIVEESLARLARGDTGTNEISGLRWAFDEAQGTSDDVSELARESFEAELALVRRQADHLMHLAATGGDGRPSFLLLISDGWYEDPAEHYLGVAGARDAGAAAAISDELAQTLSAYEWIVFGLPLRQERQHSGVGIRASSDFDTFNREAGGVQFQPKARDQDISLNLDAIEINIAPILAPLRKMTAATAGHTVRTPTDLEPRVTGFENFWRAHYLTSRPADGMLRSTAARFVRGPRQTALPFARSAPRIQSSAWVRSATPPPVVEARLRTLLEGQDVSGPVALAPTLITDDSGETEVSVLVDWKQPAELIVEEQVRLSAGFLGGDGRLNVRHAVVEAGEEPEEGPRQYSVRFDFPSDRGPVALHVEALRPAVWGSAVVE